jgi:hypothetical protein
MGKAKIAAMKITVKLRRNMGNSPVVFVGFKPRTIEDVQDFIEEPQPPAHYTKEATLNSWYKNKFPAEMKAAKWRAGFNGLTGMIDDLYAVDPIARRELVAIPETDPPAVAFLKWLMQAEYDLSNIKIIGFGAWEFARVCGLEAQMFGMPVPPAFWSSPGYDSDICQLMRLDPYKALTTKAQRDSLNIFNFLKICGFTYPKGWKQHNDPYVDCELAMKLATKFNLCDPAPLLLPSNISSMKSIINPMNTKPLFSVANDHV